ncbi:MAG: secretin N-terminal domain-containing protein [Candidatus Omnitrophota bacterium]
MRKKIGGLITLLLLGACARVAQAEELASAILPVPSQVQVTSLAEGIYGKISLDLRQIDINDALKYFSLKSGLNIITSKMVSGRVTLVVEDVPVKDVFDIMLRSNGLAYDKTGDIYNVMTQEEYKTLYGKRFSDVRVVEVFRLQYALPEQAFAMLDTIKSEIGRILVDTESGTVLCLDSPGKIEQMKAALVGFERETLVKVFDLNYAKAAVVEEQLKSRLDEKKVGSIKADVRSNRVVVQALPDRMTEIEKLIKALDTKTREVLIDAKVLKVKVGDELNVGVRWEGLAEVVGGDDGLTYLGSSPFSAVQATTDAWRSRKQVYQDVGYAGSYASSGTTSNYSSAASALGINNLHYGVIGSSDIDAVLTYLKTENNAKILSNPKIAVTNNQEARIHVGERQAYVTTTTTSGQSTSTISEDVNFIDIGIQMHVIPTISENGFVNLQIKTEISSVVDVLITPTENRIPIVDTSLAETTVLIKEGKTVIIGGLRREEVSQTVRRVPILSKIPILGFLFKEKSENKYTTELLIMITPIVITGDVLVLEEGKKIGVPEIKEAQEYKELERRKKEIETYQPVPSDLGGMNFKKFKVYEGIRDKD